MNKKYFAIVSLVCYNKLILYVLTIKILPESLSISTGNIDEKQVYSILINIFGVF